MVFQQYALFPHMDVTDNIGYGLRQRNPKPAKQEVIKRVDETLEMVRLSGYGKSQGLGVIRWPAATSGPGPGTHQPSDLPATG